MCQFFSFVGDGYGNYRYADWETRKGMLKGEDSPDSHTWLLRDVPVELQDRWSRYEFNPLTKKFVVDQEGRGGEHNHEVAEKWVNGLDFGLIVPQLIIKPIVNPLEVESPKKITIKHKRLLKQWDSVWDSVWASVRASVGSSVGSSVWDSVWASVRDSVRDSVRIYVFSFFSIEYPFDFSSYTALWEMGLVPSFDGTTWRLHSDKDAKVRLAMTKAELEAIKE